MRRLLIVLLLLCLPAVVMGEELYPAKGDNGLYGYINERAEWIIPPQFDGVRPFRGDYAVVSVYPEGFVDDPEDPADTWDVEQQGIIDRTGCYVLEPLDGYIDPGYDGRYYGGEHTGIWVIGTDEGEGFFDIPSGYCSPLDIWVWGWISDSCLIPVQGGYMDRTNGEMVIKGDFYAVDPGNFHDGIASVSYTDLKGEPIKYFMMNEEGNVIPLPAGVSSTYGGTYSHGRMVVVGENDRYGYADGKGNIAIPLIYLAAKDFCEGYAAVQFAEGDWGFIDVDGSVLAREFSWVSEFDSGYARVGLTGTTWTNSEICLLDRSGNFLTFTDSRYYWSQCEDRIWHSLSGSYWKSMVLLDGKGRMLTKEAYDLPQYDDPLFAEGLQAVGNGDGQWGFIDIDGQVVIPLNFTYAENFDGALAWVRMGDQVGYIDKAGNAVYMWDDPIE